MSDAIMDGTKLGVTKQDLVAAIVQKELAFKAKLLPTITDFSQFAVKGAKSVSIPKTDSFTVVNRAEGVAGEAKALTAGVDKIDLNINAYIQWIVDDMTDIQSVLATTQLAVSRAVSAHARYFDSQVISVLKSEGTDAGNGPLSKDNILAMRETLIANNADADQLTLLISPQGESVLLKVADFINANKYGSSDPVQKGVIGTIYGAKVIVSSALSGTHEYFMYDKDGVGFAFQKGPSFSEQPNNNYGANASQAVLDQLYGVKALAVASGASKLIMAHGHGSATT